jgi:hypothetical protein
MISPHRDNRRYAPAEAGQICTLFATVVVQVDAERPKYDEGSYH